MNYIGNSKKIRDPSLLSIDRYLYLDLDQTEPNLGFPEEKNLPSGFNYYALVTIDNPTITDKYWIQDTQISINAVDGISIFEEGFLVGISNTIQELNFIGNVVDADVLSDTSTISLDFPPSIKSQNGSIIFIFDDDFDVSNNLLFNSTGLVEVKNELNINDTFTIKNNLVGVNSLSPTQTLDVIGDIKIDGTIYDRLNFPGISQRALTRNSSGIRWLSPGITISALGNPGNVQYKNIFNLIGGASQLNYDPITTNVGVGSSSPNEKLDIIGNIKNLGNFNTENNLVINNATTDEVIIDGPLIDSNSNLGQQYQFISSNGDGSGLIWKSLFSEISGGWGDFTGIKTDNTLYTNNSSLILYVNVTLGFYMGELINVGTPENPLYTSEFWETYVGSYAISKVSDSTGNLIEVCRFRDNGNENATFLYLNNKFFVPSGADYRIDVYENFGSQFLSSVTVYSWSEFELV